ncbi:TPA: hypothetical protein ACPGFQ_001470 [Haemophilus influenzae]|uniref:hypothetical protein n=1 Tax=Haemophilus influenzae TaxID=727 RepID=UPI00049ACD80|nr:hypothetical protein [Haemophilus influenzae]AIB45971.1 hypothetical protein H733_1154 [Haemophilus influenzae CGSHiCZ412602]AXP42054.1 hypothetical protein CH611_07640 [Haemophilus influenzae]AXP58386.1 hypothetical protein CH556_07645 [Haemophilus influenzae]MCK8908405.1 hypothetical protein [Haemophilus influenzae]MCK8927493.1 hypothetical protein [Haemophilus influenzae]
MKNWQFKLVSGIAVLFCWLYFNAVMHYGADKTLLDKTVIFLTFLGTLAGIMAAISVIYALVSFKDFKQNFNKAESDLGRLYDRQSEVKKDIEEKLSNIKEKEKEINNILKETTHKEKMFKYLYQYVLDDHLNENERDWLKLAIDENSFDMRYRLYSILAQFKQDENELREKKAISNRMLRFNDKLIEIWLESLPYYEMLARVELKAHQVYRNYIRYIFETFAKESDISAETISYIKQLIFDVVRADEFYSFDFGIDDNFINALFEANKKLMINYSDLESYHLINQYNSREKRISNVFKS